MFGSDRIISFGIYKTELLLMRKSNSGHEGIRNLYSKIEHTVHGSSFFNSSVLLMI